MSKNYSVVQVVVKHKEGTKLLYVKLIETILGMPPIIDFTDNPWAADSVTLTNELFERVYHELNLEAANDLFHRLRVRSGIESNQTVQVKRVDVTLDGWEVTTDVSKCSPTLAIQSMYMKANKIVVLDF